MKPEDRYHHFVRRCEETQYLIRVTATSILCGACREMIANFTARSLHGILSLPSISFRKPKTETWAGEFGSDHLIQENTREQPTLLPTNHDQYQLSGIGPDECESDHSAPIHFLTSFHDYDPPMSVIWDPIDAAQSETLFPAFRTTP